MGEPPPSESEIRALVIESSKDASHLRRPMNAFLIFCKKHRTLVREKNPHLDNRSVTRILGELWAKLPFPEKDTYLSLAKQYRDAFMKANPDFHWHGNKKETQAAFKPANKPGIPVKTDHNSTIVPGKLADPSNMGGLGMLLVVGNQGSNDMKSPGLVSPANSSPPSTSKMCPPVTDNLALLQLAEMCSSQLQSTINNNVTTKSETSSAPTTSSTNHLHAGSYSSSSNQPLPGSYAMTPPWTPQYEGQLSPSQEPTLSPSEEQKNKDWPLDLSKQNMSNRKTAVQNQLSMNLNPLYSQSNLSNVPTTTTSNSSVNMWKVNTGGPEMPSGRMIVDKMIETVFNREMFQESKQNEQKPTLAVSSGDLDQRKRSSSVSGSDRDINELFQAKIQKQGPMTFGEIQETLIRKAMEDCAVLNLQNPNSNSNVNRTIQSNYNNPITIDINVKSKQPVIESGVKVPLNVSHMGMDLAVRNRNFYNSKNIVQQVNETLVQSLSGNSSREFVPVILPSEQRKSDTGFTSPQQIITPLQPIKQSSSIPENRPNNSSTANQPIDLICRENLMDPNLTNQPKINPPEPQQTTTGWIPVKPTNNTNKTNGKAMGLFEAVDLLCREELSSEKTSTKRKRLVPLNATPILKSHSQRLNAESGFIEKSVLMPMSKLAQKVITEPQKLSNQKSHDAMDLLCREEFSGYDSEELNTSGDNKVEKPSSSSMKKNRQIVKSISTNKDLKMTDMLQVKQQLEKIKTENEFLKHNNPQQCEQFNVGHKTSSIEHEINKTLPPKKRVRDMRELSTAPGNSVGIQIKEEIKMEVCDVPAKDQSSEKKPRRRRRNVIEMTLDPYGERLGQGSVGSSESSMEATQGVKVEDGGSGEDDDGVRKSKRRNRGQKYQELLSKGLLQAGRQKRTESTSESGDAETTVNTTTTTTQQSLAIENKSKRKSVSSISSNQQSTKLPVEYTFNGFNLDAEIASLPHCEINPNKDSNKTTKSSQYTKGQPIRTSCTTKKVEKEIQSPEVKEINIAQLHQLTRGSITTNTTGVATNTHLSGSQKRKARSRAITRLVEIPKKKKVPTATLR